MRIAIIGAGFGGLAAAIELRRHGRTDFVVFERADSVGGVWQANSYPGAACDVPSVIYQFSYALKPDWSRRYGRQAEIASYLEEVAREQGVLDHIRFGCEVVAATFEQATGTWSVALADQEVETFDVVICATGQLSRPQLPDVPGRDLFAGAQFHSAEWEHDIDLTGKKVVVVGGGASAIQIVPAIVDQTRHLTVVQRSPSWVVNKHDWTPRALERRLMRSASAMRLYHDLMWLWFEARYPVVVKRMSRPVRWLTEQERKWTIRRTLHDERKVSAVTPDYQFGCNRLLLSNDWYPTLARENVDVRRASVTALAEDSVICSDGTRVPAEVLIWCTGFTATEYLAPIHIQGRDGRSVRDAWRDGPEAYLGIATPGFPNLFMSYGPNTNSLTNTIVFMVERQAAYIRQAIDHLARAGGAIEVRRDIHDRFNSEIQRRFQHTTFTTGCPGWYTSASGKVTSVWVGSHIEYGRRTRTFEPDDYEHRPAPTHG